MNDTAKHKRLQVLLAAKKANKTPDYYLNREISQLKAQLGMLAPPVQPKKKKSKKTEPRPLPYLQGLRIAVDVAVSQRTTTFLIKMGFAIVATAKHSEPDEEWVRRAYERSVDVVVTDDLQIHHWGRQYGFVVVNSHARGDKTGEHLYRAIVSAMEDELDRTP